LTDNVPEMTALSNDLSYEDVFAEQLRGLIGRGDVVVAFSGSGNSPNVLRAVELAHQMGGITIGFSGFGGGRLSELVDVPVVVPNDCMEQVEDVHMVLCHLTCTVLRERSILAHGSWGDNPSQCRISGVSVAAWIAGDLSSNAVPRVPLL